MKKFFIFMFLIITTLSLASCGNVKVENEVKIITPYGTPYLALGGLLDEENVKIDAVNGADGLKTALVKGEYDVVVAPINLGAQLFNKGNSKYVIEAVITMNNAYIITENGNKLDSIKDLEGQNVLGFGQTGIPGSVLKTLYTNNDLDQSLIDFSQASSSAVYSIFAGGSSGAKYALMSEPEISKLVLNDKFEIKTLDLCKLLGVDVPQACVYVNPSSNNLEEVNKVLSMIEANVKSLNENTEAYVSSVIALDRTFEATGEEVLIRSIPLSNITYKDAKNFKNEINNILTILGVKAPNDEFYYQE